MNSDGVSAGRMSDTALMLLAREGDESAFGTLYNRYHRKLLNFFYGLSHDAHTAQDLCHETFLRIWRLRARYAASGSFPGYLFSFARHIWLEKCRESKKRTCLGIPLDPDEEADRIPSSRDAGPEAAASRNEIDQIVFTALDNLPEEQRTVFIMRTVEGLSLGDIAEAMGCPVNTVRSRKLLAIRKLRELLRGLLVL